MRTLCYLVMTQSNFVNFITRKIDSIKKDIILYKYIHKTHSAMNTEMITTGQQELLEKLN